MSEGQLAAKIAGRVTPESWLQDESDPKTRVAVALSKLPLGKMEAQISAADGTKVENYLKAALAKGNLSDGDIVAAIRSAGRAVASDTSIDSQAKRIIADECVYCGYTSDIDLSKLLEFGIWTLGLAIAIPIWLQTTFLPLEHNDVWFWVVAVAMVLAVASVYYGVRFRMAATRSIASDTDSKLPVAAQEPILWYGRWHSRLLVGALFLCAVAFGSLKVWAPEPKETCTATLTPDGAADPIQLSYTCPTVQAE